MKIYFRGHNFRYSLEHVVRMFRTDVTIVDSAFTRKDRFAEKDYAYFRYLSTERVKKIFVLVSLEGKEYSAVKKLEIGDDDSTAARNLAIIFFDIMSEATSYHPVYGILTGVRPLKIVEKMLDSNITEQEITSSLAEDYRVSEQRATILLETARASKAIAQRSSSNGYSLYISIPFCPSRCNYCSFVSQSIEKEYHLKEEYLPFLIREIEQTAAITEKLNINLESIYIGGGTPTILEEDELSLLLATLKQQFPIDETKEYTLEAGRPETIMLEKLQILKENGVNRISINPQTFDDAILERIGRKHSSKDIYVAFEKAKQAGFININADLIAGLPSDTLDGFNSSLNELIGLNPKSITVHALTLKRASRLVNQDETFTDDARKMVDSAYFQLKQHEFYPYYLYRQKATLENLENIGYAQKGYEGIYNVFIMDEVHSILSCGAAGVTKIVNRDISKIDRIFNYKYPREYMKNFDEVINRKNSILSLYRESYKQL